MKAGILPRLNRKIVAIYLEATSEDTDARLLRAVQKAIPDAEGGSLQEVLSAIRRRRWFPAAANFCWSWTSSNSGCTRSQTTMQPV